MANIPANNILPKPSLAGPEVNFGDHQMERSETLETIEVQDERLSKWERLCNYLANGSGQDALTFPISLSAQVLGKDIGNEKVIRKANFITVQRNGLIVFRATHPFQDDDFILGDDD
jgi:hypothetical protein